MLNCSITVIHLCMELSKVVVVMVLMPSNQYIPIWPNPV